MKKKIALCGLLLGLLTGVAVAQRGRMPSPTARPDVNLGTQRSAGVSPTMSPGKTTTRNQNVSPTAEGPVRDPQVGTSATTAPNGTTANRNVDPTVAPVRDPLPNRTTTTAPNATAAPGNVDATAAPPIRDPK